ncbi:hypothetical protein CFII68_23343 [Pseudomonas sp. CFII68]|nr:hypothetical protein CFII68_23343 [Pseudomonas sp. CFII68]
MPRAVIPLLYSATFWPFIIPEANRSSILNFLTTAKPKMS